MALAEKAIKEVVTRTVSRYDLRVRGLAFIYIVLNLVSLAIAVAIIWRGQYFVTLSQLSKVEMSPDRIEVEVEAHYPIY